MARRTKAKLMNDLAALRLGEMSAMLPSYMDAVASGERDLCGALLEMTDAEVATKRRDDFARRVRAAGFPYVKTLADFDLGFQPSVPRARVEEITTLRFLETGENVLLVGSSGPTRSATASGAPRAGRTGRPLAPCPL